MDSPHELLPIFPLTEVLFPHSRVQVHVTSPVHQELIKACLRDKTRFGVCFARNNVQDLPCLVGTFAVIRNSVHFEDGRIDVTIDGGGRFRVRNWNEELDYVRGLVEPIHDEYAIEPDLLESLAKDARELHERILRKQIEHEDLKIDVLFPSQPTQLAFAIASMLSISMHERQYLLELTDPITRLQTLIEHLKADPACSEEIFTRLRAVDLRDFSSPN